MTDRSLRLRKLATQYGPYLLTAIVVWAILRKYPLGEITAAMRSGNAWALFPVAIIFAFAHMFVVSAWDTIVFRAVLGGPSYFDIFRVKSGCAVLQSIGYLFNAGAYGTWIARSTGTGARVAVALILFTAGSDLAAGALVATGSILLSSVAVSDVLRFGAPMLFATVLLLLLGQPREPFMRPSLAAPGTTFRPTLADRPGILRVFRAVPRGWGAIQLFGRMINVSLIIIAVWAAANAFGMPLPFHAALAYVPLIMLVGSLPVNVMGFGAVQGVWLLFTDWVPGPQILAFQILWNVAVLAANTLRGAVFVPRLLREVAEGPRTSSVSLQL